jgi:hypothetical protein
MNRPADQIKAATRATFQHHQFEPARPEGDELVFQKRGTFMNSFMSADWFDGPAWIRVKVFQHPLDTERTLLDCDIYVVQQPEDPLFQQERKLEGRNKTYQQILEEIATAVSHEPVTPSP